MFLPYDQEYSVVLGSYHFTGVGGARRHFSSVCEDETTGDLVRFLLCLLMELSY